MTLKIVGYRGIANKHQVYLCGHAFRYHRVKLLSGHHREIHNFKQMLRRFKLKPMKEAEVLVRLNNDPEPIHLRTDRKGFFEITLDRVFEKEGWYPYSMQLPGHLQVFESEFLVSLKPATGVISDIDDTILVSHSRGVIKKLRLVLFFNALTRKAFPGIVDFYNKLKEFKNQRSRNLFFYVSRSEWNLYDFLVDFFEINQLPKGIFLLDNLKTRLEHLIRTGAQSRTEKVKHIEFILNFYPNMKFVLIGDTGQHDMDIYHQVCQDYPDRVEAVLIHRLNRKKDKRMIQIKEELANLDIPYFGFSKYREIEKIIGRDF